MRITDIPHLERWLKKQGYPDKEIIFAPSAESPGRPADDTWTKYTGIDSLPDGKRVIMRRSDLPKSKGGFYTGVHVLITKEPSGKRVEGGVGGGVGTSFLGDSEEPTGSVFRAADSSTAQPPKEPSPSEEPGGANNVQSNNNNIINRDTAEEWKKLRSARDEVLRAREDIKRQQEELNKDKNQFYDKVKEELGDLDELRSKANKSQQATANILKDWESTLAVRRDMDGKTIDREQAMLERIAAAEEKQAIAAAVSYGVDKVTGLAALWRVKKIEDLPPDMVVRFQNFANFEAQQHFYASLPRPAMKLVEAFQHLSPQEKQAFLKVIAEMANAQQRESQAKK